MARTDSPAPDKTAEQQLLEKMEARIDALVEQRLAERLAASQQAAGTDPALAGVLARLLQGIESGPIQDTLAQQKRLKEALRQRDEFAAWIGQGLEKINRDLIRQRYGDGPRWFRLFLEGPEQQPLQEWPVLAMPGHSEEEARGRYYAFCGITSAKPPLLCEEITAAEAVSPAAPPAAPPAPPRRSAALAA